MTLINRSAAVAGVLTAAVCVLLGTVRTAGQLPEKAISLTPVGVYRTGLFDRGGSEIAAYDAATRRLFTVNLDGRRMDVIDISTPSAPFLTHTIDITPWGGQANSVSVHDGVVAVAVEAAVKTNPGKAVFFNAFGGFLAAVTVGALPDMLTFTPNGQMVLVANEGEPNSYGFPDSVDPEGSVSIIDLSEGAGSLTQADVTTAGFSAFNGTTLDPSIRIYGPGATVAKDLEPEYIAVSHDSQTAWVTLQENNALGIIDLKEKLVTRLVGLGFKNHNVAGAGLDTSDRDNHANAIEPRPILGMYQPDGIATVHYRSRTYLLTANEGDVREWRGVAQPGVDSATANTEARRVSALNLDTAAFPNAATLIGNAVLVRLNVTVFNGNTDADPAFEQLYAFGARSFSVWDEEGRLVFDSGDALEQITRLRNPSYFNANHTNNVNLGNPNDWTHDSRSDDKGPEPENVNVAKLFGRDFAFIVLERIGGVMIYELIDPTRPTFVDYVNTRVFGVAAESAAAEDLGPEGIIVVQAEDSPNGKPLLVVANEVSGTTRIYEIEQIKK
jgi:DNA-binding beta-propeller fold protein YncE